MIRLETRLRLQRPARDCLWFVTDFRNLPLWDASVKHAEKITLAILARHRAGNGRIWWYTTCIRAGRTRRAFSNPCRVSGGSCGR